MSASPDILSLLATQASRNGTACAIRSPHGPCWTHQELHQRVARLGRELRMAGVAPDARVAIVLPNGLDISLALLGVSCAAVAVPLNPAYQAGEYENYFREAGVTYLLIAEMGNSPATAVAERLDIKILEWGDDTLRPTEASTEDTSPVAPDADRVAVILLTSGSTGRPKKVPLTHRNLCAAATHVGNSLGLGPDDLCLNMWEQHHIGGLVDLLLAPLAFGGSVICAGSFNTGRFFKILAESRPTWFQGVPTTLRELMLQSRHHRDVAIPGSLRFMRSVAAALPPALMADIEKHFGVPVIQTFGMTEASPLITTNRLPPGIRKPGSAGSPCGPEVAIMDGQGRRLPNGEYGEVAVRGENVFSGYEDNEDANSAAFKDGWFYTGDTGYFDADGYLFLRGRVKEMINRGGEKISPFEIEDVLSNHPAVSQVAAFSLPHASLGEDVGVAVVRRPGHALAESELLEFAANRLSPFKIPRTVLFLDELPRCPVGKIRRQELAEAAMRRRELRGRSLPRTELESLLARLWASELDIPEVGIDDDFAALGGDSLSSIRLVTATESLLSIRLPDYVVSRFKTVRKMAQYLEGMGQGLPGNGAATATQPSLDIESALAAAALRDELPHADRLEIREHLSASLTSQDFHTRKESLLNLLTPAELGAIINQPPPTHVQEPVEFTTWCAELTRELAAFPVSLQWSRRTLNRHAHLYSTSLSDDDKPGKTLIVGFCGRAMRLMMPTYRLLMHLDENRHDLLLLRDPGREHYANGIPGIGEDMDSLGTWLDNAARGMGYERIISFGTSSGGLAALCVGIANGWRKAIAVGADAPSKRPRLEAALKAACAKHTLSTQPRAVLLYGALNQRDHDSAIEIGTILPSVKRQAITALASHNVLDYAYGQGKLSDLCAKMFSPARHRDV